MYMGGYMHVQYIAQYMSRDISNVYVSIFLQCIIVSQVTILIPA